VQSISTPERPARPPRLGFLQARRAAVAVIFRRGPSKRVELIRWDTEHDIIERGHWFHGRIYNRRSDLSPDGTKLIYFASKFTARTVNDREYTYAWTAISKPPWLTALALWPKGDCWWGGGLFGDDRTVFLNHRPNEATPRKDHQPPRGLKIRANRKAHGEDDPLYSERLTRDGWQVLDEWEVDFLGLPEFYKTIQPQRRTRSHPHLGLAIELTRHLDGLKYRERFTVTGAGPSAPNLEHADWVDWDHRGRLIVLRNGRLAVANVHEGRVGALRELVDLTPDRPEPRVAPDYARRW
jgi:hypothetical protein